MNDCSFTNVYMYLMFLPSHSGKAKIGCDTYFVSNLISRDIMFNGFSEVGVSFWVLMTAVRFRIEKMPILTECIPLQSVPRKLLSWNMIMKKVSILYEGFKFFRKMVDSSVYLNNVLL